jgi:hypothetical protein
MLRLDRAHHGSLVAHPLSRAELLDLSGVMNVPMVHALPPAQPVEENTALVGLVPGGHIGDFWAAVHAALSLPSSKATINLEYYRLNDKLSNEISFSGVISVLDAEVGLLRI